MTSIDVNCLVIEPMRNFVVRRVGNLPFDVRVAIAFGHQRFALFREQHRAAEAIRLHMPADKLIDLLLERDGVERCRRHRRDRPRGRGRRSLRPQSGRDPDDDAGGKADDEQT